MVHGPCAHLWEDFIRVTVKLQSKFGEPSNHGYFRNDHSTFLTIAPGGHIGCPIGPKFGEWEVGPLGYICARFMILGQIAKTRAAFVIFFNFDLCDLEK